MMKRLGAIAAIAMMLSPIGGGATQAAAAPPDGGTIALQPKTADGEYDPSTPAFIAAVSDALAARGFTILEDPDHAAYVGELVLSREDVGTGLAKAPPGGSAITPGGGFGSVGAGVAIPLSSGRSQIVALRRTRLELKIRRRGQADAIWDGAAMTVRSDGTKPGADGKVAADLAGAILRSYPAEPQSVVGVP